MPCPFTGPKIFCTGPNFLSQPKNLTAFSASSKTFVSAQKPILLNANHLFVWHKMFVTATICNEFLVWHKKFGPAQNILGPVKGQSITRLTVSSHHPSSTSDICHGGRKIQVSWSMGGYPNLNRTSPFGNHTVKPYFKHFIRFDRTICKNYSKIKVIIGVRTMCSHTPINNSCM